MTWNDYQPIPRVNWKNVDVEPEKKLKGALILYGWGGWPSRRWFLCSGLGCTLSKEHGLHFYVLEENRNAEGILSYRVAVRSLNGSGSFERGVNVSSSTVERAVPGRVATYNFSVTNTGEKADLIRIQAKTKAGWKTRTMHNVIEVKAGETKNVPVYVKIPENKQ